MSSPAGERAQVREFAAEDWDAHRLEISRLYKIGTLESVTKYMKEHYGIDASDRQYKYRFGKWGIEKNIRTDDMEAMIAIERERMLNNKKETAFVRNGSPVDPKKINRYKKEHAMQGIDADPGSDVDKDVDAPASHSDISAYTPSDKGPPTPLAPLILRTIPDLDAETTQRNLPELDNYPSQGYGGGYGPPSQQYPPQPYYSPPLQNYGGYQAPQGGYGYQPPLPQQPYGYSHPPAQQYGGYSGVPLNQPEYGRPAMPSVSSNAYINGNPQAPPPPPQGLVGFGHQAPAYSFQYSNCSGHRKALLIGINYFGQRGQLKGCINDIRNMSQFLNESFGYKREDMVILTDDQQNSMSQPTKQNILRAMHWLVKDAQPNDSLFFHYSGHGGQTKDLDGDEEDGYDEVIYPVDFRQVGHIVDDDMHNIMVKPLQPGVRLTAIFDSCHSGTALDLPYIYSTQGLLKEPNLAKEAGLGLLGVISNYSQGNLTGVTNEVMGFFKKTTTSEDAYNRTLATKTSPADVIMWSGSKDDQTSADANTAAQATGAMSWAFISAVKKNPQQSYVQLLNSIRDELATRYTQRPQLSCSHPLNTNLLFVM